MNTKPLDELPFVVLKRKDDFSQPLQVLKNGDPVDLTGLTGAAISVCLPNADGATSLTLTIGSGITILSAVLGKFSIDISSAQSALLELVDRTDLDVVLTIAGKKQTYRFERVLTIEDRRC